ncbi:hypothetical protein AAHA92_22047 [Salvia divinorum]|uniref:Secreted protein n=1 Tax=Salvia divinorum TaxID=28513 RepID=A0ABD1GME8_SALDI
MASPVSDAGRPSRSPSLPLFLSIALSLWLPLSRFGTPLDVFICHRVEQGQRAACVSVWGCREGEGSGCAGGCSRRGSGGVGETNQRLFHRRRCSLSSSVVVTSSTSAEEGIGSAKRGDRVVHKGCDTRLPSCPVRA